MLSRLSYKAGQFEPSQEALANWFCAPGPSTQFLEIRSEMAPGWLAWPHLLWLRVRVNLPCLSLVSLTAAKWFCGVTGLSWETSKGADKSQEEKERQRWKESKDGRR